MRPVGTKTELEARRRLAVSLHRRGQSIREVARLVGCAPGSVARWSKMYADGGSKALDPIPGTGGTSRLDEVATAKLRVLLHFGARASGFSTEMWTLRRICQVIHRELGVQYTIAGAHVLMRRLGYSPQKATRRAREQDEAAVEAFRRTTWVEVKKKPKKKGERSR